MSKHSWENVNFVMKESDIEGQCLLCDNIAALAPPDREDLDGLCLDCQFDAYEDELEEDAEGDDYDTDDYEDEDEDDFEDEDDEEWLGPASEDDYED